MTALEVPEPCQAESQLGLQLLMYRVLKKMLRVYIIYDSRCLLHPHLIPRRSKKACNSLKIFAHNPCMGPALYMTWRLLISPKCSYL